MKLLYPPVSYSTSGTWSVLQSIIRKKIPVAKLHKSFSDPFVRQHCKQFPTYSLINHVECKFGFFMARRHLFNQHRPLSIGKRLVVVYYPRRPHWIFRLFFLDVVPPPPSAVGWCSSPSATILGRLLLYYHRRRTLSTTNLTTSFLFHFPRVLWLLELPPALLSTVPHDESYHHHHHAVRKHFSFIPHPGDSRHI